MFERCRDMTFAFLRKGRTCVSLLPLSYGNQMGTTGDHTKFMAWCWDDGVLPKIQQPWCQPWPQAACISHMIRYDQHDFPNGVHCFIFWIDHDLGTLAITYNVYMNIYEYMKISVKPIFKPCFWGMSNWGYITIFHSWSISFDVTVWPSDAAVQEPGTKVEPGRL